MTQNPEASINAACDGWSDNHREHQEVFVRERLLRILEGDVKSVIVGLRQMATRRTLSSTRRAEIETVCGYLTVHADRMQYDPYLAAGCSIATGVIEGACRHLVKDRLVMVGRMEAGAREVFGVGSRIDSAAQRSCAFPANHSRG